MPESWGYEHAIRRNFMDPDMERTKRPWRHIAIAAVLSFAPALQLAAQASTDTSSLSDSAVAWRLGYQKNEKTAVLLGALVPGLGHLYAGEWWKSYVLFVGTTGSVATGAIIYQWPRCGFNFFASDCSVSPRARVLGAAIVTATLAGWAVSAADAGAAVDRGRERRVRESRLRRDAMLPVVVPCGAGGRSWCVGVSVAAP